MKQLVLSFLKWLIIVLATLTVVVWSSILLRCQEVEWPTPQPTPEPQGFEAHPRHSSAQDAEDDMRFMRVKILSVDAHYYYVARESRDEVKAIAFRYDNLTFADKSSGTACVVYCTAHMFVYVVTSCRQ